MQEKLTRLLVSLYGEEEGRRCAALILEAIEAARNDVRSATPAILRQPAVSGRPFPLTEADTVLITYGDSLVGTPDKPLVNLRRFLSEQLGGIIRGVHVLPFSPYTSDDGFSVSDYDAVNPELGTWGDIETLASEYILMADLVLNHCSASHPWFQGFLQQQHPYDRYFIAADPDTDTRDVVRPRARPLLTRFETVRGPKWVWTTFSEDQVDLNYANPEVLRAMIDVLILYLRKGVRIVRLDAVAYVWKELGTSCIHLPQTHAVVQLMRLIVQELSPEALLITETNVPHAENISYFGDGANEAHMVYNFSLPPLTLDAFVTGDASILASWATDLRLPGEGAAFFNFLSSHDGIGVQPAVDILPSERFDGLLAAVQERGGRISYKTTSQGDVPYELNIAFFSAIVATDVPESLRIQAFVCAHAIMCALAGVPALYIHSLVGSHNWTTGMQQSGHNRTINRRRLDYTELVEELSDPETTRSTVLASMLRLVETRNAHPAFSPTTSQEILESPSELFVVGRDAQVLCIHNVSDHEVPYELPASYADVPGPLKDLLSGAPIAPESGTRVTIEPYGVLWFSRA
ncbi:MAG: sugar phosphorylase [Spirochaetaceae bacterium]